MLQTHLPSSSASMYFGKKLVHQPSRRNRLHWLGRGLGASSANLGERTAWNKRVKWSEKHQHVKHEEQLKNSCLAPQVPQVA